MHGGALCEPCGCCGSTLRERKNAASVMRRLRSACDLSRRICRRDFHCSVTGSAGKRTAPAGAAPASHAASNGASGTRTGTVLLVESPAKAKKIQTYLGDTYKVHPSLQQLAHALSLNLLTVVACSRFPRCPG